MIASCADDSGGLRAGTRRLGHGGTSGRGAHREALEEAGRGIGCPEGDDLLIRVDMLAAPRGDAPRDRGGVGQRHECHAGGSNEERRKVVEADVGERRRGEARGYGADNRHTSGREIEHAGCERSAHDRDQDARHLRPPAAKREDDSERRNAHDERRSNRLAVTDTIQERFGFVPDSGRIGGETEERRELTHQDDQRDSVEEADTNRLRQELSEDAEAQEPGSDAQHAHEQRERARERDCLRRVTTGAEQRKDRGGDQWGQRRVGAQHQDARGSECRVRQAARRPSCTDRSRPASPPVPRTPFLGERAARSTPGPREHLGATIVAGTRARA